MCASNFGAAPFMVTRVRLPARVGLAQPWMRGGYGSHCGSVFPLSRAALFNGPVDEPDPTRYGPVMTANAAPFVHHMPALVARPFLDVDVMPLSAGGHAFLRKLVDGAPLAAATAAAAACDPVSDPAAYLRLLIDANIVVGVHRCESPRQIELF
jgi:hypothetical protein